MQLEALCVVHIPKNRVQSLSFNQKNWPGVFYLDTCQRWIWVSDAQNLGILVQEISQIGGSNVFAEVFKGKEAYLFLLRLATGLLSEVVGETDIFGQFKEAWRQLSLQSSSKQAGISQWVQRVFEDTKEIRTQYLQSLGGSSYGSLVRKLLRDRDSSFQNPILVVGAGQIARSVAPLLLESELWLWNRDPIHLCAFYEDLLGRAQAPMKKIQTKEEEAQAWKQASHIVICIPFDSTEDQRRIQWFLANPSPNRTIIHLGGMKEQAGLWQSVPQFYCLSDLFALNGSLSKVRSVQVTQAERACEERAKLRALGVSLSIPHGWEDLACFA
jgi:hypothetical protein